MRLRIIFAAAAIVGIVPRIGIAQASATGCWEFRIGGSASRVQLDTAIGYSVLDCGERIVRVSDGVRGTYRAMSWVPVGQDSVRVRFTTGLGGITMRLAVEGDTLRGVAQSFSDVTDGFPPARTEVFAVRVPCPPDSSAIVFDGAVQKTSPGLRSVRIDLREVGLQVGDSIFASTVGISGDGQAFAPTVIWRSSDSTVARVDSTGLIHAYTIGSAIISVTTRDARAERRVDVRPRTFASFAVSVGSCGTSGIQLYCTTQPTGASTLTLQRVPTHAHLVSIAGGFGHFCGLDADGAAWCWGLNDRGQLGTGDLEGRVLPTRVSTDLRFASLSLGRSFSCGLTRDGALWCWGDDALGQLGAHPDESDARSTVPIAVMPSVRFRDVSAGLTRSCGVTLDGDVFCWGRRDDAPDSASTAPTRVAGRYQFRSVSSSGTHACALAADQRAYCWGENESGQLGDGTRRASDTPVAVRGSMRFERLNAMAGATCGLAIGGRVFCWGSNALRLLGRGPGGLERCDDHGTAEPCSTHPIEIMGGHTYSQLVHSVSLQMCALTPDGVPECWGAFTGAGATSRACGGASGPIPVGVGPATKIEE